MKCFASFALFTSILGASMALPSIKKECDTYIEELDLTCPTDMDGVAHTYADPDRCNEYWECYNGCANHMMCSGDQLYDEVTTWCNTAQYVSC